jgi:nanoRNase/pAp phosphatase (c-di-AMP/oligoRNAs hydrolase)
MKQFKVVSISHSVDPDGIGSQAILFRYFKELKIEPIGLLADYYNFKEVFNKALQYEPDVLIITDIGINKHLLSIVMTPLQSLEARVIWIDHHKITPKNKELINSVTEEFIHNTSVCAAELVQERFLPDDPIAKKIAKIAHKSDFDIDDYLGDLFYTLIDFYRFKPGKLVSLRETLASGNFETDRNLKDQYLEAYRIFEAERDRIRRTKRDFLLNDIRFSLAYSEILPRGKITKFLTEISDADIVIGIDTNNNRVGMRSNQYNVAILANAFGGGRHSNRSGFTYPGILDGNNKPSARFIRRLEEVLYNITKKQ